MHPIILPLLCVFTATGMCLPSHCIAMIEGRTRRCTNRDSRLAKQELLEAMFQECGSIAVVVVAAAAVVVVVL